MSTGRSPYPLRSLRRQQALQAQAAASGSIATANNNSTNNISSSMAVDASLATPGSAALLQMDDYSTASSISPRHSTASGANNGYRLGRSLVQARLSPRPGPSSTEGATATAAPAVATGAAPPVGASTSQGAAHSASNVATTRSRRFFPSPTPPTNAPTTADKLGQTNFGNSATHHQQNAMQTSPTSALPTVILNNGSSKSDYSKQNGQEDSPHDDKVDGINLSKLRNLAKACLGQTYYVGHASSTTAINTANSPSMAVFYASMVYAKSIGTPAAQSDALLYSQTLLQNGEPKRCVRLLEQAGLFAASQDSPNIHLRLEATLIATQALATLDDWQSVLALLEDPHLYHVLPSNQDASLLSTSLPHAPTSIAWQHQPQHNPYNHQLLDDDDDIAWQHLANAIDDVTTSASCNPHAPHPRSSIALPYIHPLARVCCWRGRAYAETGHPMRAALFYKRALQLDGQCVEALEGLLDKSILPPHQTALDTILHLQLDPDQEWLRALYLARIHVAAPTTNANHNSNNKAASTFGQDHVNNDNGNASKPFNHSGSAMQQKELSTTYNNTKGIKSTSDDPFWQDASSIQLLTPITAKAPSDEMDGAEGISFFGNRRNSGFPGKQKDATTTTTDSSALDPQTQAEVEGALDTLMNTFRLSQSSEVLAMAAQRAYRQSNLQLALKYCQELARVDPLCTTAGYVHVSSLVAMGYKRSLFRLAHEWVEAAPKSARAWFAVGSYYFACGRYHVAQRHFCRATRLDSNVVEAWIAFGVSFAACDESDQALASFRAAQRLAPGDPTSLLYIGMEYLRTNHKSLAEHFLMAAHQASRGTNRLCLNELGVWYLSERKYDIAAKWLLRALGASGTDDQLSLMLQTKDGEDAKADSTHDSTLMLSQVLDRVTDVYWEATVFNLAQALRKLRKFDHAILCLERCLTLKPQNNSSALSAMGFCLHLRGDLDAAIDVYHQALATKPGDPFCGEMLQAALKDALELTTELFDNIGLDNGKPPEQESDVQIGGGTDMANNDILNKNKNKKTLRSSTGTLGGGQDSSSFWSEDGLSISVEMSSDVDMG